MKSFISFHIRDAGLMFLSVGSGSSDALAFVVFGSVFTSAMTGNTALIGIASGRGHLTAAHLPILALIGFVAGAMLAVWIGRPGETNLVSKLRRIRTLLLMEIAALIGFAAVWHLSASPVDNPIVHLLVLLSAAAMGIQGIAARMVAEKGINTIVLTSTMLSIVTTITDRLLGRSKDAHLLATARRQITVVVGYAIGAALTAFLTGWAFDLVPWPPLLAVTLACLCACTHKELEHSTDR